MNLQIGPKFNASWQAGSNSPQNVTTPPLLQMGATKSEDLKFTNADVANANTASLGSTITNTPITPEPSNSWKVIRFFLVLMALAALMYFFGLRH